METHAGPAGLVESVTLLLGDLRQIAYDRLELAALEAQRAGAALAFILAGGIVIGALVASAWLGAMAAMVWCLTGNGIALGAALLLAALLNLAFAFVVAFMVRRKSLGLRFPATVQSFRPSGANPAVQART